MGEHSCSDHFVFTGSSETLEHPLHSSYRRDKYRQKRQKTYMSSIHSFERRTVFVSTGRVVCKRLLFMPSMIIGIVAACDESIHCHEEGHKASELRHYKHICAGARDTHTQTFHPLPHPPHSTFYPVLWANFIHLLWRLWVGGGEGGRRLSVPCARQWNFDRRCLTTWIHIRRIEEKLQSCRYCHTLEIWHWRR